LVCGAGRYTRSLDGPLRCSPPARGSSRPTPPRSIPQLLEGKQIDYPHMTGKTFKKAPKAEPEQAGIEPLPGFE